MSDTMPQTEHILPIVYDGYLTSEDYCGDREKDYPDIKWLDVRFLENWGPVQRGAKFDAVALTAITGQVQFYKHRYDNEPIMSVIAALEPIKVQS